jgi:hypothetical protein
MEGAYTVYKPKSRVFINGHRTPKKMNLIPHVQVQNGILTMQSLQISFSCIYQLTCTRVEFVQDIL